MIAVNAAAVRCGRASILQRRPVPGPPANCAGRCRKDSNAFAPAGRWVGDRRKRRSGAAHGFAVILPRIRMASTRDQRQSWSSRARTRLR